MFTELFRYAAIVRRHREGPLASERAAYLVPRRQRNVERHTAARGALLPVHRTRDPTSTERLVVQ